VSESEIKKERVKLLIFYAEGHEILLKLIKSQAQHANKTKFFINKLEI